MWRIKKKKKHLWTWLKSKRHKMFAARGIFQYAKAELNLLFFEHKHTMQSCLQLLPIKLTPSSQITKQAKNDCFEKKNYEGPRKWLLNKTWLRTSGDPMDNNRVVFMTLRQLLTWSCPTPPTLTTVGFLVWHLPEGSVASIKSPSATSAWTLDC